MIIISNWTTYTGIWEIDGRENVCTLGGPRIQVAQPRYGSTAGFRGMTDIPYCPYCQCYWHIVIVIVIDYLAVGPGLAPVNWVVVSVMYGTHLKHGQCLQPISFNNIGPRLAHIVAYLGCVYYMWQFVFADIINNKIKSYIDIVIYMLW